MAKRIIGANRLFNLGDFKNLTVTERIEIDDEDYTEAELDALRYANLVNVYLGFAMHQKLLQDVKEVGFEADALFALVIEERRNLEETINDLMEDNNE